MRRSKRNGLALADLLFAMVLIAFVLIPMVGLFPMGHRAVQKGRDICVASGLAEAQINQVRMAPFPTGLTGNSPYLTRTVQTVGGVDYQVLTQIWPVAFSGSTCTSIDILVDVTYPDGLPFEYGTRLFQDTAGMQAP